MNESAPMFHRRSLAVAALGLLAGLLAGRYLDSPVRVILPLALLLIGGLLFLYKRKTLVPFLLLMALGVFRIQWAMPQTLIPHAPAAALSGVIADAPAQTNSGLQFPLKHATINGEPVEGRILLTLTEPPAEAAPRYGDSIALTAAVYPLRRQANEGGFDAYTYYLGKGVTATAYSKDQDMQLLPGRPSLYGYMLLFRDSIRSAIYQLMGEEYGSLAVGMLLGDTGGIEDDVLQAFRDGGVAHLLAVSGLHVTLLCGALYVLLKRAHWKARFFSILGFLLVYCILTGFKPSAIRASVMSACLFFAQGVHRRCDGPSSLALAFLILALWNPFLVFSASMQLSFGAVGGLMLLTPVWERCFPCLPQPIRGALAASLSAQMGILPFQASMFHRLSWFGILINILVIPLASLVLLPLIGALLLYLISPAIAAPVAEVARITLALIQSAAGFSAGMGVVLLPAFSLGATACYGACCVFLSPLCLLRFRWRAALSGLCLLLCVLLVLLPVASRPNAYISVLVTQGGYAVHLRAPTGDTLLTDGSSAAQYAAERYAEALCLRQPERITSEQAEQWLELGGHTVHIRGDLVEVNGQTYSLAKNGRLRISLRQGSPIVTAYGILGR